jgi:hypothetical protein
MIRASAVGVVAAAGLALCACATGQSSSFATRVGSGGGDIGESPGRGDDRSRSEPDVLASSGNVLLPGAFSFPVGDSQLLAGLDLSSAQSPGLTALATGGVDLTLTGPNGPAASVDVGGALQGIGGGGPVVAALSPLANGLSPATSALAPATGAGPLVTAGAQGVSLAGQPLTSLGGAGSVLTSAGSVAGAGLGAAGAIATGVATPVSTVVNAAGQAVAGTPPAAGAPAQPVTGLGGLGALLPRVR